MSYLEQLKAKNAEKAHPALLTKPTQGTSDSFVSTSGCHVWEKEDVVVSHDATLLDTAPISGSACTHQEHFPPPTPTTRATPFWERPSICYACGGMRRWRSIYGVAVCGTCHPPADAALAAGWEEEESHA